MIYMIRHGETEWNKEGRHQGLTDITLNSMGVRQALQAGEALKDIHFDYIFTSPLLRSYQTLRYVLSKRGIHDRPAKIISDARIVEFFYGDDLEGKVNPPEVLIDFYGGRKERDYKNAEAKESVEARAKNFFDEILKLPHENILVITHGGFLRVATWVLTGKPADRDYSKVKRIRNCEIIIYDPKTKTLSER